MLDYALHLELYLPRAPDEDFVLLTYAQSLDSRILAAPGVRTRISSSVTKDMTHYLRSRFQGILVGVGTFLADDPGLNCRFPGSNGAIRPIILDPSFKSAHSLASLKMVSLYKKGEGQKPIILIRKGIDFSKCSDYDILQLDFSGRFDWSAVFSKLKEIGIRSVMVEGGADVINQLLPSDLINSVIITIGPVFLGLEGVAVSPTSEVRWNRLDWWFGGGDAVFSGLR